MSGDLKGLAARESAARNPVTCSSCGGDLTDAEHDAVRCGRCAAPLTERAERERDALRESIADVDAAVMAGVIDPDADISELVTALRKRVERAEQCAETLERLSPAERG